MKANGGLEKTQGFYRLFMVPGMDHCYGGVGASNFGGVGQQIPPARDAAHDLMTALEAWVERGVAPAQFIGTKYADNQPATKTVQFTREGWNFVEVRSTDAWGNEAARRRRVFVEADL